MIRRPILIQAAILVDSTLPVDVIGRTVHEGDERSSAFSLASLATLGALGAVAYLMSKAQSLSDAISSVLPNLSSAATPLPTIGPEAVSPSLVNRGSAIPVQAPPAVPTPQQVATVRSNSALPSVNTPSADVAQILDQVAAEQGVDRALLYAMINVESGFNPTARAASTGATGLAQITRNTWNDILRSNPGLGYTAADIRDPKKNATVGAIYLKQMKDTLSRNLGREPGATDIYLAYFLGPTGALRFISALRRDPDQQASQLFPAAARANPGIFFANGRGRSLREVYATLNHRAGGSYSAFATKFQSSPIFADPIVADVLVDQRPDATTLPAPASSPLTDVTSVPQQRLTTQQRRFPATQIAVPTASPAPAVSSPVISNDSPRPQTLVRSRSGTVVTIGH